ncbi:phosphoenolpyruvate hydrolase family protein [Streptomyces sp. R-07]|uniref:phosphoenolpyruvate hydrolase family protein n=1 Tax=Streptomyces sp. R-07 TaxID=3404052 RepID=UPI003CFB1554
MTVLFARVRGRARGAPGPRPRPAVPAARPCACRGPRAAGRAGGRRRAGPQPSGPGSTGAVQEMHDAAERVNPDVLVLCHGGPIAEPEDARYVLEHTTGVVGLF